MSKSEQLHPRAEDLLAYADGQLNPDEIDEIEALLKHDLSARTFLEKMQLSDLPYSSAFEPLLDLSDIEPSLPIHPVPADQTLAQRYLSRISQPVQLAAALLIGLSLSIAYQQFTAVDRSNWMVQVAEYQQLYVRDTLQTEPLTQPQILALQKRLSLALDAELKIPDLSRYQLKFIRGQILQVNDQPLIQLVYLPQKGGPIALCVTPKQFAVSEPTADTARGLAMIHWNSLKNSFVLMGDHPSQDLMRMAQLAQIQIGGAAASG